jgi:ectoine hydroxylase-related dioxygenase (phytanoyl-CoA dioxygenase family)|tara:strand:+ start:687 stop:1523 length:837 start_codon:yes stop_codon:yes gene_type:complete
MVKLISKEEIEKYNEDGVIFLKNKFDIKWIENLKKGIEYDIKNPSPRFKSHTIKSNVPAYLEDYWTWDLVPEFKDFVFNSPYAEIASELMSAKKINLVMDNWFLREAGSKSSTPFHHDISYFDMEGTMCVLWLPLEATRKDEGIAWVKSSHLWDKLFLRVLFKDGHKVEGNECTIDGKKYELPPDVLGNKDKYEFLQWDFELGDAVIFDMRSLHGTLSSSIPQKTLSRYTLRVAKEDAKISYVGDWTSYNYRKAMQEAGYKDGDKLGGKMFPILYEAS